MNPPLPLRFPPLVGLIRERLEARLQAVHVPLQRLESIIHVVSAFACIP